VPTVRRMEKTAAAIEKRKKRTAAAMEKAGM
jgi:hypothetical protein